MRRAFLATVLSSLVICSALAFQDPGERKTQTGAQTKAKQSAAVAEQELMRLEHAWADALVKGDIAFFERIEADDFTFTGPDGRVTNKTQDIAEFKSGAFKAQSAEVSDLAVRVYGDSAIVTGINNMKATHKGKDISGKYRFTDVFHKRGGRWQAVATHVSPVVEQQQRAE